MDRRDFVKQLGAGGALAAVTPLAVQPQRATAPADDRAFWVAMMRKLADPVLTNLAAETLKQRMPVEQAAGAKR